MKENELKKGDRVLVVGTDWSGVVVEVDAGGSVKVRLSDDSVIVTPPSGVRLADIACRQPVGRGADGRFTPGNSAARRKKSAHYYQSMLRAQMEPFLANMGTLIMQIEDPGERVLAISRMMPYAMPKLAQVEYNENIKRNYTAEEQIAKLNAEYHHLPDPTAENEGEEDE